MSATSTTPAEPQRFDSLAAMQDRHVQLLKEIGAEVLTPAHLDLVTAFIRLGKETGALLDGKECRAAAQGLINFWVARLGAAVRTAEREGTDQPEAALSAPRFEDTLLVPFDTDRVGGVAEKADRWLRSASAEDQQLARRVLLRLVRMPPDADTFEPVSASRGALWALGPAAKVDAVIDALAAAGAVQVSPAAERSGDQVELRYEALTRVWAALRALLDERRQFRDAVRFWAHTNADAPAARDRTALITGPSSTGFRATTT
jgi:hypothetical protein